MERFSPRMLVAGGAHVTVDGVKFLVENPLIDVGVVGEGEETMLELCDVIEGKKKLGDVRGIIYREHGRVVKTPGRVFIKNLDALPFPDYTTFDSVKQKNGEIDVYPINTSRGCPYNCIYCAAHLIMGRVWRARSPGNVIEELKHAKKKHGIKGFEVWDDNFSLDMERAKSMCDLLESEKIGLPWEATNGMRADRVDRDLLVKMKRTGCSRVTFGIESADPEVFKGLNKGETLDDIKKSVKLARECGLSVTGFFIVGLPGSTFQSEQTSIEFAKENRLDGVNFSSCIPFPGTGLWEWAGKNARALRDYEDCASCLSPIKIAFETDEFPEKERCRAYNTANVKFRNWWTLLETPGQGLRQDLKKAALLWRYDRRGLFTKKALRIGLNHASNFVKRNALKPPSS